MNQLAAKLVTGQRGGGAAAQVGDARNVAATAEAVRTRLKTTGPIHGCMFGPYSGAAATIAIGFAP